MLFYISLLTLKPCIAFGKVYIINPPTFKIKESTVNTIMMKLAFGTEIVQELGTVFEMKSVDDSAAKGNDFFKIFCLYCTLKVFKIIKSPYHNLNVKLEQLIMDIKKRFIFLLKDRPRSWLMGICGVCVCTVGVCGVGPGDPPVIHARNPSPPSTS
jgi:hypothetical protein